jgi:hypothetical protein
MEKMQLSSLPPSLPLSLFPPLLAFRIFDKSAERLGKKIHPIKVPDLRTKEDGGAVQHSPRRRKNKSFLFGFSFCSLQYTREKIKMIEKDEKIISDANALMNV